MNKVWLRKYFRQIEKKLVGGRKEKAEFINGFTRDVTGYIELHTDCTLEDIHLQFGLPEDIAKEFISTVDEDTLRREIRRKRLFHIFITIILVVLLVLTVFRVWDMYNFHTGHYEVTAGDGHSPNDTSALNTY